MGLEGWGYQDVLPFFKKSEDFVGDVEDRDEYHGQGGDMKVTSEGHKQPIIDTFLQAGEELGYKVGDFNGAVQEDIFTSAHTTTHRGFRSVCLKLLPSLLKIPQVWHLQGVCRAVRGAKSDRGDPHTRDQGADRGWSSQGGGS